MSKDKLKLKGQITVELKNKKGKVIKKRKVNNVITNVGKGVVSGLIGNVGSETAFTYLAVGTGTTSATSGDTSLESELSSNGLSRASATVSQETTSVTDDTLQLKYTWTATSVSTVTEAGMFNAGSGGDMLGRQTFSAINTDNGFELTITYKVQLS